MKKALLKLIIFSWVVFSCKKEDTEPNVLKVYELSETVNGLSYSDLEKISTEWLIGIPAEKSAALDEDGKLAAENLQPNKEINILPFNFGGASNRTVSLSASKPVYVPMLGYAYIYWDNDACDPDFKPAPGQSQKAFFQSYIDEDFKANMSLLVTLDGENIVPDPKKYRAQSEPFDMVVPADFQNPDCPLKTEKAHVMTSTYALLLKIPKGKHVLKYKGTMPGDPEFVTEVTYNLTMN
jgi:hypothetical protein